MTVLLAFLIGFFGGLRSLVAPATTAWALYFGWLKLQGPLALIGSIPSVAIFTLLAVVELVADKLPQTPNRTSPPGLMARVIMGGLTGACIAVGGGQGVFLDAMAGVAGGVAGCFRRFPGAHRARESPGYEGLLRCRNRGSSGHHRLPVGALAIVSSAPNSCARYHCVGRILRKR
jgi:uncharacterized membrane protein